MTILRIRRLTALIALVFACAPRAFAQDKPNIVLIVTDDLGYGDVSSYGATGPASPFRGQDNHGSARPAIAGAYWSVGEVLATLDRLKLTDNTLVIFTSDRSY